MAAWPAKEPFRRRLNENGEVRWLYLQANAGRALANLTASSSRLNVVNRYEANAGAILAGDRN
jgi:hypothetical protein